MKVYNQTKTQILDSYDLELGHLEFDKITIHHDAIAGVKEQGHFEVTMEYPNGGRDLKWVVDKEGIEPKEAYDKEEDIMVYIPYTEEELAQNKAKKATEESLNLLNTSDYTVIKFMDSFIRSNPALLQEFESQYPNLLDERAKARTTINENETILGATHA